MKYPIPIFLLLAVVAIMMPASAGATTTYIPVGDEIYPLLDRLEAEGLITSGLLNTRPISRAEAERLYREAEGNSAASRPFIKDLIASLRRRLGASASDPSKAGYGASVYARYIRTDTALRTLQFNNDGDKPADGSNLRVGADLRIENAGPFAIDLNPEYRDSGSTEEEVIHHGYAVIGLSKIDMALGKDSQWWGPGRHGSILLSNNAEPFTMVRFTNPEPVILPWFLSSLGDFRFTFFATQLERDRDFRNPYLWGMRFDFKPGRNIEVGLQRTAILGGQDGRKDDAATWGKSIFPFFRVDNTGTAKDPGDQRAGFDVSYTVPSAVQPIKIYLEGDGEDLHIAWPNLWAWVAGVYLPRIGSLDHVDLRLELATTQGRARRLAPYVWYNHTIYTSGYTYNGDVIGHHIGTASRDLYLECSYHLPERDGRLFLAFDFEQHNIRAVGPIENNHEAQAGVDLSLYPHVNLSLAYRRAWIRNVDRQSTPSETINSVNGMIRYDF